MNPIGMTIILFPYSFAFIFLHKLAYSVCAYQTPSVILFIECFRLKCNRFKMSKVQKINFTKFTKFLFFSRIVLHMVLKYLCPFIWNIIFGKKIFLLNVCNWVSTVSCKWPCPLLSLSESILFLSPADLQMCYSWCTLHFKILSAQHPIYHCILSSDIFSPWKIMQVKFNRKYPNYSVSFYYRWGRHSKVKV